VPPCLIPNSLFSQEDSSPKVVYRYNNTVVSSNSVVSVVRCKHVSFFSLVDPLRLLHCPGTPLYGLLFPIYYEEI